MIAMASANTRNVRRVPISGMSNSADSSVPTAEPVADRQGDQDDADGVGPHDGGRSEVGTEQPDSRDLGAERPRPHHEDEQGKGRHSDRERSYGRARGIRARSARTRRPRVPLASV